MLTPKAYTARGGGKKEKRGKREQEGVCGWEGGERRGSPWSWWRGTTHRHQHAAPLRREGARAHPTGAGTEKDVGLQEALIAFGPVRLCMLYPGRGFGVCFFFFNLFFFFFLIFGTRAALNKSLPITCSPARSRIGNTRSVRGLFRQGCVNSPSCGVGCERGPLCVPPPPPWRAPAIVLACTSSAQDRDFHGYKFVAVSSGALFRLDRPQRTWPTPHHPQRRLPPSRSAPQDPRPPVSSSGPALRPHNQTLRIPAVLLPPVFFFHLC